MEGANPIDMATISEVISEANLTIHQCTEDNEQENNMTISATTSAPSAFDKYNQGSKSVDDEVSFKTNAEIKDAENKTGNHAQPPPKPTSQPPDFESMSNGEFMQLLYTTFTKHQDDTKKTIQSTMDAYKKEVTEQFSTQNQNVSALNEKVTTISQSCVDTHSKNNIEIAQLKNTVKCLVKVVIRQGDMLQEKQHKDEENDLRSMHTNLVIRGVIERKPENCVEVAKSFFTNVMKIDGEIPIQYAHRLGKNKN